MNRIAFRSERVVTPDGVQPATVIIENGTITDVGDKSPSGLLVHDFGARVIMPGLVDSHVHINEPGRTEWEGFETATKAAAAGGVTTLVDMPLNSSPVTTTTEALRAKVESARGKLWVDCGFYGGLIPGNVHHLNELIDGGVLGIKAFLIHSGLDEFPAVTQNDLHAAMPILATRRVPLLVHCELQSESNAPIHHSNPRAYREYLISRPAQWELDAIELMIEACRTYGTRTHIVHLSSADALPALQSAKAENIPLTVETCPHYLYFAAEEIPDGDTRYKCAPPIREQRNREQLWRALAEGVIDFIVSDHSPCPLPMKLLDRGDFLRAWGGISSLQFTLPIVWTEARRRGHHLHDIARWMCTNPAALVGLQQRKGKIARGFDADIVVWEPEAEFTVSHSMSFHKHKDTPYERRTLAGMVMRTYVRGHIVFDRGTFSSVPHGTSLLRKQHE